MRVEVLSDRISERRGEKDGKSYCIREQEAFLHQDGQKYPQRIVLSLGDSKPAYAAGMYALAPENFYVGRYGQIEVKRHLELVPASADLRKAS